MATFKYGGSRIANPSRVWQAAEDVSVSNYEDENMILAVLLYTLTKVGVEAEVTLQWRNKTDAGSFTDLSGSGELTWTAITDLVNLNTVVIGEKGCVPPGSQTWINGVEREGANTIWIALGIMHYTEYHWAVNLANAHEGDEYEFRLWDKTNSMVIGVCLATVTIASEEENTIEEAIVYILVNDSDVNGLAGERVWPNLVPQGEKLPGITYQQISGPREQMMSGPAGMVRARYQLNCWAESYEAAKDLFDAVRLAMDSYIGTVLSVVIDLITVENEGDVPEEEEGLDVLRRYGKRMDCLIWYKEAA